MKTNLTRSLFAFCAALAMASCTKEPIEIGKPGDQATPDTPPTEEVSFVFTAAHEDVNITKTNLSSELVPYWVSGDAIGVTTSTDTNVKCDLVSAEEGTFNGSDIKGEAPFYAVYPYAADNTFDGSVLSASVPAEQVITSGQSVAQGALVAACVSSTNQLEFKNCVSLMQIEIPANIKEVVVASAGEKEYLAGKFTMDMSASELAVAFAESDESLSTSVTLKPEAENFEAGTYYIAVLPTSLTGISLTFTNDKDETVTIEKSATISLARSNGVNFGTFFVYDIDTPKELYDWAKSEGKFTAWDVVNLNKSIDMSEYAADYIEAVNFEGTFNGNGNTISGLTTPLFANLYGSVNNLTLNSNITYKGRTANMPGHNQVVGILAHIAYNSKHEDAKISNVTTKGSITVEMGEFDKYFGVAGLVGGCNGITVENCENQAAVEVKSLTIVATAGQEEDVAKNTNRILAGGITAQTKGNTTALKSCKNTGSILIGANAISVSQSIVGGVAAYTDGNVTYTVCSNEGNVTNSAANATGYFTGGVIGTLGVYGTYNGASSASWNGTFNSCSNSGAVVDNSAYATAVDHNVGGVVGYACINQVTIDGLTNSGTVELSAAKSNICSTGGVIGQIRQYRPSTVQNCTNAETATVTIRSECAKLYAGGVFAYKASQTNKEEYKAHITVLNCHNKGNIVNNGTASTEIRIGGIAGQLHYSATFGSLNNNVVSNGCSNSGSIISSSAQTATTRIGGIFGQAADILVNVYDSKNTGSISVETTATLSDLYVGGIGGILGTTPVLDGCSSNCTITKSGNITAAYGAALIARSSSSKTTIKNCKVAGTVFGETITAENFGDFLCAYYSSSKPTTVLENNSFLSE